MSRSIRSAAALALLALLSGCQLTMVENLPAGAVPTCPAQWRGAWIAVDEAGRDDPDFGIVVQNDCGVESREKGNPHPAKPPLPHPAFFQGNNGKQLVFLGAADAFDLIAAPSADGDKPPVGYVVLAWSREGERMNMRQADHRRVATLIVQGALPGKVNWQNDGSTSTVIVGGDPNAVAQAFGTYDFFEGGGGFSLRRVGDDAKALERALKRAAGQKSERKRKT